MRSAMEPVVYGVTKRWNMRINRIAGLIARDIERGHAGPSKPLDQTGCHQPLFTIEVSQSTQDEPGVDAAGSDGGFGGAIHGGQPLDEVRGEPALKDLRADPRYQRLMGNLPAK